ncbi:MAG: HEAT repeat domain-containing protein [Verrucomicrobiota bacterium]
MSEFLTGKPKEARAAARARLLELKEPVSVTALTEGYATCYQWNKGDVLALLGELGFPEATPFLKRILQDKSSHLLQMSAANALGRIRDPGAVPTLLEVLAPSFWRHPHGWNPPNMGFGTSRQEALRMAEMDEARVRCTIINALFDIGTPEALQAVTAATKDADPSVQSAAKAVLALAGTTKSSQP